MILFPAPGRVKDIRKILFVRSNPRVGRVADEGVVKAHLREVRELGFGQAHATRVFVFVEQCGVEHGGVVGGENDGDAMPE